MFFRFFDRKKYVVKTKIPVLRLIGLYQRAENLDFTSQEFKIRSNYRKRDDLTETREQSQAGISRCFASIKIMTRAVEAGQVRLQW